MLYGGSTISDYSSTLGLRASTQTRRLHALAACCGNHKQLLWEPLTVHAPQTHPHPLNLNSHLYMHAIINTVHTYVHTVHVHMRCNKYVLYGIRGSAIYKHTYQPLQVLPKLCITTNNNDIHSDLHCEHQYVTHSPCAPNEHGFQSKNILLKARPMTILRISDVPAPISYNLASRRIRPSG